VTEGVGCSILLPQSLLDRVTAAAAAAMRTPDRGTVFQLVTFFWPTVSSFFCGFYDCKISTISSENQISDFMTVSSFLCIAGSFR